MSELASSSQEIEIPYLERENPSAIYFKIWLRRTPHDQVGSQNARRANTNAGLGCSVGRAEASEDNCAHATHGAKEWLGI